MTTSTAFTPNIPCTRRVENVVLSKPTKKLRIGYVCEFDIDDPNERSGVPYFIAQGFRALGHEIVKIGPFGNHRKWYDRAKNAALALWYHKILKGRKGAINNQWSKEFLTNYSKQAEEQLKNSDCDFVFSPESHTIAYLNTDKPIVYWRDATFGNILNYYPEFSGIHPISQAQGHESERQALQRARLAIYTSDWAAHYAIETYGADEEKVAVIERGANLLSVPSREDIMASLQNKTSSPILRLLFVAANWERKGGDIVLEILNSLKKKGIATELHIVGGRPASSEPLPAGAIHHGYVKKTSPEGQETLKKLHQNSHFFIMPSRAENFGIVFAEASAYGLPSIALDTGGVSSAIHHGQNGLLFPQTADHENIASKIAQVWQDKFQYVSFSQKSRKEFEERLNWERNCSRLINLLTID